MGALTPVFAPLPLTGSNGTDGSWQAGLTLPTSALLGDLFLQAFYADATASGLAGTNGLRVTVGN